MTKERRISGSNNIIDFDYKCKRDKLNLWLTTQDKEITLDFAADTDCDWHTHMRLFGANTPDEELEVAIEFVERIISDQMKIIHSSISGYYPVMNLEDDVDHNEKGEVVSVLKWSDL